MSALEQFFTVYGAPDEDVGGLFQPHEHHGSEISGPFSEVAVIGDIFSTNWDGANPADLSGGRDLTATTGIYIDSSAGVIQAHTAYLLGGEIGALEIIDTLSIQSGGTIVDRDGNLEITSDGSITIAGTLTASDVVLTGGEMGGGVEGDLKITGVLDLDDSGRIVTQAGSGVAKIELTTASADRIVLWSGLEAAAEDAPAYIRAYDSSDHPALAIVSATEDTDAINYLLMQSAGTTFLLDGTGGTGTGIFGIEDYTTVRFRIDGGTHIQWSETVGTLAADTSIGVVTASLTLTGSTLARLTDGTRYVEVNSGGTDISGAADVTGAFTAGSVVSDAQVVATSYVASAVGSADACGIRVGGAGVGLFNDSGWLSIDPGTGLRIEDLTGDAINSNVTCDANWYPVFWNSSNKRLQYDNTV